MCDQSPWSAQRLQEPRARLLAVALQPWVTPLVALCGLTCMHWKLSQERPYGSVGVLRSALTEPSPLLPAPSSLSSKC